METPDKIYVTTSSVNSTYGNKWGCWTERECAGYAYIRKDALLEWAKEKRNHYHERGNISDMSNPDMPFFNGKENAFKELIDRIESL